MDASFMDTYMCVCVCVHTNRKYFKQNQFRKAFQGNIISKIKLSMFGQSVFASQIKVFLLAHLFKNSFSVGFFNANGFDFFN